MADPDRQPISIPDLDDRSVRVVMVPLLGAGIAIGSGLMARLSPLSARYWFGILYFVIVAFAIWQGNRYFWYHLPRQTDWLAQPRRRALMLVRNSLPYTLGLSVFLLWAWYPLANLGPPDWHAIWRATALCLVSVAIIVHSYETVYLIRQRAADRVELEKLEQAKLQAELSAQIDPHFLFNSLHTLAGLSEEDPARAADYTVLMADLYRYILDHRHETLVPLGEELEFLRKYCRLLSLRFEDRVKFDIPGCAHPFRIPPVSLQTLIENAVKHNRFASGEHLVIHVRLDGDSIIVQNVKRPHERVLPSPKTGLRNLDQRCRLALQRGLEVQDGPKMFEVRVPLSR